MEVYYIIIGMSLTLVEMTDLQGLLYRFVALGVIANTGKKAMNKKHLDKQEAFDIAHCAFDGDLRNVCPTCAAKSMAMLLSMLAIQYNRECLKHKLLFDHHSWLEEIVNTAAEWVDIKEDIDGNTMQ
jgi:hypothetical protein